MPNSEPSIVAKLRNPLTKTNVLLGLWKYGSRQKRMENFNALVEFLETWKKTNPNLDKSQEVAERFCNMNFQYGYVSRNDIVMQALMKVNLL